MNGSDTLSLSIIIVSYNTKALTLDCLKSVYENPPPVPFEVIVLDNASSDGSHDAIRDAFPQVTLIDHHPNVGFAAGNNIAIERASGRRILLLNPDTFVFPGTLPAIWNFAEREPQRGIWGGRTLFPDHSLNPTSCWRRMSLWSLLCSAFGLTYAFPRSPRFNPESYGDWRRDTVREVDIVTGCFLLIDADLWHRLGGFDRTFFMYAEEADLCLRARAVGARPAITPDAELVHYGGASEVSGTDKVIKTVRGRVTLMRKHWSPLACALGRLLLLYWAFSRMLASRFVHGRKDDATTSNQKWTTIWRRRAEWLAGYPVQ